MTRLRLAPLSLDARTRGGKSGYKGRNSPYAEALAQALKRTDLPILEQLDWVADEVHRKEPSQ